MRNTVAVATMVLGLSSLGGVAHATTPPASIPTDWSKLTKKTCQAAGGDYVREGRTKTCTVTEGEAKDGTTRTTVKMVSLTKSKRGGTALRTSVSSHVVSQHGRDGHGQDGQDGKAAACSVVVAGDLPSWLHLPLEDLCG